MQRLHRIRTETTDVPFENASSLLDSTRLVFVMGCPRSGTTFLQRCLSRLPRTVAWSGTLIPDRLCHVIASGSATDDVVEDLLFSCRAVLWRTFVDRVRSRRFHLGNAIASPGEWRLTMRILTGREAIPLPAFSMVYKEPFLSLAAAPVARHFQCARFIHLIRDGRDCADSLERTYGFALSDQVLDSGRGLWREAGSEIGRGRDHAGRIVPWWVSPEQSDTFLAAPPHERYLWLWHQCVTRARAAGSVDPGRYLEIRYEDLCREPAATGGRLLEFLGLEGSRGFRREFERARPTSIGISRRAARGSSAAGCEPAKTLLGELGYV